MFNNDASLAKLKSRMEGKTVIRVEPPQAPEAICQFVMSDGSVFRLHATELGFWVKDTVASGESYSSLDQLFQDYEQHVYYQENRVPIAAEISDCELTGMVNVSVTAPDGRVFKAKIYGASLDGLLLKKATTQLIIDAAELGDAWKYAFASV